MKRQPIVIGQTWGDMTICGEAESSRGHRKVQCECVCGSIKEVFLQSLYRGLTKNCGCRKFALMLERSTTHGASKTPTYKVWMGMLMRADGKTSDKSYYERGITVCDKGRKFENFVEDMGVRPSPNMTIERVDNEQGYSPDNCVWADKVAQARNRRNTIRVTYRGKVCRFADLVEQHGVSYSKAHSQLRQGVLADDIFSPLQGGSTKLHGEFANHG